MLDFVLDYFTMWNRLLRKVVSEAITWFYFRKKKKKIHSFFLIEYLTTFATYKEEIMCLYNPFPRFFLKLSISISCADLPSMVDYMDYICKTSLSKERSCSSLFIACVTFCTLSHWFQVAIESCWIVRTLTGVIWSTRSSINLTHC